MESEDRNSKRLFATEERITNLVRKISLEIIRTEVQGLLQDNREDKKVTSSTQHVNWKFIIVHTDTKI